ncbi:hypothetical protein GCM10018781_72630 [Kitasatospora indigofera]|uniref:Uncharacterized protein n=1 Tax=Kitasatospora indigofera TaxID=67307 RepID=A0A919L4T0_9ACTN|nr:hypothetical protein GCM10018781_72630 [Kitasatospora indigofera]
MQPTPRGAPPPRRCEGFPGAGSSVDTVHAVGAGPAGSAAASLFLQHRYRLTCPAAGQTTGDEDPDAEGPL